MALSDRERGIVQTLTETKAVDFDAIGRALAQFGPTAALDFDYEPVFCGTMRYYVHVFQVPFPGDGGGVVVTED
jgi:hypothetical protein